MNFWGFFRRRAPEPATAPVARRRLKVLLAHERAAPNEPNLVSALREDILGVISRHVRITPERVRVTMNKRKSVSLLKIDIELPA